MKYEEIRHAWNAQAEDFNQWIEAPGSAKENAVEAIRAMAKAR